MDEFWAENPLDTFLANLFGERDKVISFADMLR